MASTQTAEQQVSIKLLVNKETNKVLFAEAGKDFVDVLCSFLTLPLGTIARLVRKESNMGPVTVGCLNSLYQSVANLDEKCLWNVTCKEMLLKPTNSSEDCCRNLKFNIDDTEPQKYFICTKLADCISYLSRRLSTSSNERCGCGNPLARLVILQSFFSGFVNGDVTFIITDDLIVMPNSVDHTSFGLLQNFGVKSLGSVKEMTVNVTKEKVLDLLKCSLLSKSTLTDFFLGKKSFLDSSRFSPCGSVDRGSLEIKVKLVMRKSDGKILFAQGEEDFADFLFSFLTYPLGAVVRELGGVCSVGSIDGLYKSIADLNENKYLLSKEVKNRLVDPRLAPQFKLSKQILPIHGPYESQYFCYYQRSSFKESIIDNEFFITKNRNDAHGIKYSTFIFVDSKASKGSHEGYIKGPVLFVATDDLVVAPMSPISVISFLKNFETPPSDLMEKVVIIGVKEGLSILKAALTPTSALTNGLRHLFTQVKEEN